MLAGLDRAVNKTRRSRIPRRGEEGPGCHSGIAVSREGLHCSERQQLSGLVGPSAPAWKGEVNVRGVLALPIEYEYQVVGSIGVVSCEPFATASDSYSLPMGMEAIYQPSSRSKVYSI